MKFFTFMIFKKFVEMPPPKCNIHEINFKKIGKGLLTMVRQIKKKDSRTSKMPVSSF